MFCFCGQILPHLSLAVGFDCETSATPLAVTSDCVPHCLRSDSTATGASLVGGRIRLQNTYGTTGSHIGLRPSSFAVRSNCDGAPPAAALLRLLRTVPTARCAAESYRDGIVFMVQADSTATALIAFRGGIRLRNCLAQWRADPTAGHQAFSAVVLDRDTDTFICRVGFIRGR
ncbi:hypothetical protein DFH06DRAFT_33705 [Mycena polygramma]|nr:hypothetical protein DFH06DRAFT_33705 [Mycena polygramma]